MRRGAARAVWVTGRSGDGKTTLVERLIASLPPEAWVLRGRCHPRESVPFNAFDTLVDRLTSALRGLPPVDCAALLPRGIRQLVRLFPVLDRLEALKQAPRGVPLADQGEVLRRGVQALRELLAGMAERRPLVAVVDDLQWADSDSAMLWRALTDGADAPRMLLIGLARAEDLAGSAFQAAVADLDREQGSAPPEARLALGPLPDGAVRALVGEHRRAAQADAIVAQAQGSPLLALALAEAPEAESLHAVILERLARLPVDARRATEAVALAGGPVPEDVVAAAAGVQVPEVTWRLLEQAHLARSASGRLATYHDSVGEAIRASLPQAAARTGYRALAMALAHGAEAQPELRARCLAGAEAWAEAAEQAALAGERAAQGLAWAGAARWFRQALAWAPEVDRRARLTRLGAVLTHGNTDLREAIAALSEAESLSEGAEAKALHAQVTWLRVRHAEPEGLAAVDGLLADVGVRMPKTGPGLVWRLLRARQAVKRALPQCLALGPFDAQQAHRFDVMDRCALAIYTWQPLRGTLLHLLSLPVAMASGDPARCAHAIRTVGMAAAAGGDPDAAQRCLDFADQIHPPEQMDAGQRYVRHNHHGTVHLLSSAMEPARVEFAAAMALEADHARPLPARQLLVRSSWINCMALTGYSRAIGARPREWMAAALRQNDLAAQARYFSQNFQMYAAMYGDLDGLAPHIEALFGSVLQRYPGSLLPGLCLGARVSALMYAGAPVAEWVAALEATEALIGRRGRRLPLVKLILGDYRALVCHTQYACDPQPRWLRQGDRGLAAMRATARSGYAALLVVRVEAHRAMACRDEAAARAALARLEAEGDAMVRAIAAWCMGMLDGRSVAAPPQLPDTAYAVDLPRVARLGFPAVFTLESPVYGLNAPR